MTCREIADFLLDYLEAGLSDGQRRCFDEHLAGCPECVVYVRTYTQAVALGRAACTHEPDCRPAVPERLVAAVLAARRRVAPATGGRVPWT